MELVNLDKQNNDLYTDHKTESSLVFPIIYILRLHGP